MTNIDPDATSGSWIRRLQSEPTAASTWEALSNRYDLRLRVFAAHLLGPVLRRDFDPEDVVNEAWLRIVKDLGDYEHRGRGALYSWMCLRVRRVVADIARRAARGGSRADESISQIAASDQNAPAVDAAARELESVMADSLESLPAPYRDILVARLIEERSYEEIAAETGIRENTLSQQLARGLELWRRALGKDPLAWI